MANEKKVCINCGNIFAAKDIKNVGRKNYCKECLEEILEKKISNTEKEHSEHQPPTQIIIHQQQQQQQGSSQSTQNTKPKGSWFWLIFWIIVCFPIAIIYLLIRRWD